MYYWSNIWRRKNGRLFDSGTVYLVQRAPAWANIHVMAQGKRSCNLSGLTDGWPPRTRGCPQKKVVHPKILSNIMAVHILNKYIIFCPPRTRSGKKRLSTKNVVHIVFFFDNRPPSWSLGLRGCIVDNMGDSRLFYWENQETQACESLMQ